MQQHSEEMQILSSKLDELSQLFKIGEKIIPGIQKLIEFMQEIVPLLNNINHSIEESNKKIPKATDHINDVTSATEMATTEILDIVDQISAEIQNLEDQFKSYSEREEEKTKLFAELILAAEGNEKVVSIAQKIQELPSSDEFNNNLINSFDRIKNDSYNITMALQVQDITSQQLSSVNHLILSVQKGLSSLIVDLTGDRIKASGDENDEIVMPDKATFDSEAKYSKDDKRQQIADQIMSGNMEKASQDEIDKLFS